MRKPLDEVLVQAGHTPFFWPVLSGLVLVQVALLWMLCSQQVEQAQLRSAAARQERTALAGCPRVLPRPASTGCGALDQAASGAGTTVAMAFAR